MDIKITESTIRKFLNTKTDASTIAEKVSLCGPTFDRTHKIDGDYLFEVEAITNRVDTACAFGLAREASVILNQFGLTAELKNDPYRLPIDMYAGLHKQFEFEIQDKTVIRFTTVALENVTVKPSPESVQKNLENCGQRAINNLVDITNEMTLLYGLPSHVFDLDKLNPHHLLIRNSQNNEEITTLNGQKNILKGNDVVIEDGSGRLVDLCGVMGGQIAEVDEHTKNILFIAPVYIPQKIRRTSLYLQNRTLASQIYEKQPDPELCLPLTMIAIQLFKERATAKVSSPVFDYYPHKNQPKQVEINFNWLNKFIGIDIDKQTVITILAGLGFTGQEINPDTLSCNVPSWRYHDINIREDLAEEVARIYGYFRLPSALPCVPTKPDKKNPLFEIEKEIKRFLFPLGFTEIYNNSLYSKDLISKTSLEPNEHLRLKNALSGDFEYLRTSLVPQLLQNYKNNFGRKTSAIRVFEIANCYQKTQNELPNEVSHLAILADTDYRQLKGELEALFAHLNIPNLTFEPDKNLPAYFQEQATAKIMSEKKLIGFIGLIKPSVLLNLKIKDSLVAAEINLQVLSTLTQKTKPYQPISEYPFIIEDLTLYSRKSLGQIIKSIQASSKLIKNIKYLDGYKSNHTFRISFGSDERNLEQSEVDQIKKIISERLKIN